ncbi:MAG: hypothetical protein QNJ05_15260 [Woeseiaceae bacterium]|nr:hypothetical protein [Woeseiaceae bacterium]
MGTIRLAFYLLAAVVLYAVVVFWPAGRLDWVAGWLYVGIVALNHLASAIYLKRVNPELIKARLRMSKGSKHWDIIWGLFFGPVLVSTYIVAGFDAVGFK